MDSQTPLTAGFSLAQQNSIGAENAPTGSVSAEVQAAQKATSMLHSVISDLEARLSRVVHQFPQEELSDSLMKESEPLRTSLALDAHVVVQDVIAATARIHALLNNLGV